MAEIVWTRRSVIDLAEIAEYIGYDNEQAAAGVVRRVYAHVGLLSGHPRLGPVIPELPDLDYRQLIEPPCRIFYKITGDTIFIVHILRSERILRIGRLETEE